MSSPGPENPKDRIGRAKVSLSKLPAIGVAHGACAMMYGAAIYGPYNWRSNRVLCSIYVDAIRRHVDSFFDGEDCAPDSGVHHLGHVIADASIVLDALACDCLIDDRPTPGRAAKVLADLSDQIRQRAEKTLPPGKID